MKKILFIAFTALILASCSSDNTDKEQKTKTEKTNKPSEKEDLAVIQDTVPAIDSTWNYYSGNIGTYDQPVLMELSFNGSNVDGSYWYAKHQKRIKLTGSYNEAKNEYELKETHKGKITGLINFTIDKGEMHGEWLNPKTPNAEGQNLYANEIISEITEKVKPTFGIYKYEHSIEVYKGEEEGFVQEEASDDCMIIRVDDEQFIFYYTVLGHNYHNGLIYGEGQLSSANTGTFSGSEGCELKFEFHGEQLTIEATEGCSYYGGARAYFGGTFTKVK